MNGDTSLSFVAVDQRTPGHYATLSRYVERFWLPVVGPSTLALVRLLANETPETGFRIPADELGLWLGLKPSKLDYTINRACGFRLLLMRGENVFGVPSHVPPLTDRQVRHLSESMQTIHGRVRARAS